MANLLCRKSNAVFETYRHMYMDFNTWTAAENVDLDVSEQKLLNSMTREHRNTHTKPEDWLSLFHQIKSKLGAKESMTFKTDFVKFLNLKFATDNIRKQFSTPDYLDHLEDHVRSHYNLVLNERDEKEREDEFDYDNVARKQPEDMIFFTKRFFPAALLFTYSMRHPSYESRELMDDIFTIGSGSKRLDLVPEMTGICPDCAAEKLGSRNVATSEEILKINRIVFKAQQADKFATIISYYSDDSSSEAGIHEDKEDEEKEYTNIEVIDNVVDNDVISSSSSFEFNPFAPGSTSKEDPESLDEQAPRSHSCNYCGKRFSKIKFVAMHVEIFHEQAGSVVPRFVDEGEEKITSFVKVTTNKKSEEGIEVSYEEEKVVLCM